MALINIEKLRGIDLPEAYLKARTVVANIVIYKDQSARTANKVFDTISVQLPITPEIYGELKKIYPDAIDLI